MYERRPRFRRVRISCQSTARDLEIVRHVARHRFLTTEHFRKLVKGSGQGIGRRLQKLFHAGVLDRPRAQLEYFHEGGGSKPIVYTLGGQGARMLSQRGEKSRIDWTAKNRAATKLFIEHTLVADFMVALEEACLAKDITLIRQDEFASQHPRWEVSFRHEGASKSLGVVPDATFWLVHSDGTTLFYCLEANRATMPVKRRHLHQTSACRKFLAYHATWQQRVLEKQFGWKRFRVLTLTTSPACVQTLRTVAAGLPSGHGLFSFAHQQQLQTAENVLSMPWREPADESPITLIAN